MKLSIVIVNYRGWKRLLLCLHSLQSLKDLPFQWEVTVVDNQSIDGELPKFIAEFSEFKFVENTGNNGFASGCNFGARLSQGEYILFLNPDTEVTATSIQQLVTAIELNSEIMILSCEQLTDQGKKTKPYGYFPTLMTLTGPLRAIHRLLYPFETKLLKDNLNVIFPDWVSGSVVLISKKNFGKVGGWDESFWMYYEDVDLCKRAKALGGKIAVLTDVHLIHNHGGTSRLNRAVKIITKTETIISKHVYYHKNSKGATRILIHAYLFFENSILALFNLVANCFTLFLIKPLRLYQKLYLSVLSYYWMAIKNKTWVSPRSTKSQPLKSAG